MPLSPLVPPRCLRSAKYVKLGQVLSKQEEHIMQVSTVRNQVPAGVSIPFWQCHTGVNDVRKHLVPFFISIKVW